mgnify:FL=1
MFRQKYAPVVILLALCNLLFAGSSKEKSVEQKLALLSVTKPSSINMGGKDVRLEIEAFKEPLGEGRELRILNFSDGKDQFIVQRRDHVEESLDFIKFYSDGGKTCLGTARVLEQEGKFLIVLPDRARTAGWVYTAGGMLVLVVLVGGVWLSRKLNKSEG